ncbi:hypothetical protein OAC89_06465, partial [Deltaproteobacteria bacterium]|nr:hypothetical protein [Deltaproteobacteria bacterium]MDB9823322.1 hypothetical protein [Deltaproteobacteria bacterium]
MIMKKRFIKTLVAIIAATILMMHFAACYETPPATVKSVDAVSTWEITDTTSLSKLTVAEGAIIKAPEGKGLTMTVDGIETGIKPGIYMGNIVLTVAEDIIATAKVFGDKSKYLFRAAIDVEDGKYVPKRSVAAAVAGGTVTDTSAKDVKITSVGERFNGIIVKGDSKSSYSIINPVINLTGNGGNDFVGFGAAIMSSGNADVTVEKAEIITRGAVRTAVFVGGNSTMHVNDSYIEVHNGTLPADYKFNVGEGMMEVPWMMGIIGNVRATNLAENGTVYYNNSHIKAQGWGCLSSDAVTNTKMFATKCLIETVESGYGAFTLGENISTFSECTFNVTDIGMISQDGDGIFTDGTVVNSGRFGVMYFGTGDYLTIEKGTVFNTKATAIMLKTPGHDVVVDNAKLNPGNGIILQVMAIDDPYMAARSAGGGQGGAPPGGGMAGDTGGSVPGSRNKGTSDVNAALKNTTLKGDLVNGDTPSAALNVTLENATITGAITTSLVKHALGPNGEEVTMEHRELYKLIGEITNTYCTTDKKYGV